MAESYDHSAIGRLEPIADHIIVTNIENEDEKISNGIIILDEKGVDRGIRPRWAQICAIGPEQIDVEIGEWVLIEHGQWTRGTKFPTGEIVRKVNIDGILLVSENKPDFS